MKPKKEYEIFARNMKFLREREKWTFEQAAEKYGVTKVQVQKYEWALNMPKPLRVAKIAKLFGLTYEEIVGEEKIFNNEGKGSKSNTMG